MGTLILLRHGESQWNKENRFTGWIDVDISEKGREEALLAAQMLRDVQILPDLAFTSYLRRAINTLHIVLENVDRAWIPEEKSWRLNERHYGALQGKNKAETAAQFGEEQVHIWRRSFDVMPPLLGFNEPTHPHLDERYADVPGLDGDFAESLETTIERALPYLESTILPHVRAGKTALVAAHGNSLRGIIKSLEGLSNTEVLDLNIPTAVPYVYSMDAQGRIMEKRILSQ